MPNPKSSPKSAERPPTSDEALRAFESTLGALQRDLSRVLLRLGEVPDPRVQVNELGVQLREALDREFQRSREQVLAALELRGRAHEERIGLIDGALSELQRRHLAGEERLVEVDGRVSLQRVDDLVARATRLAADEVYHVQFAVRVEQLAAAFADADDRFGQLRAYVDQFGPGGLPVLKQANDELQAQVSAGEARLKEHRDRIVTLEGQLADLDAAAIRQRLASGFDPSVVEQRLAELADRDRDLADRKSLSSENIRLRGDLERLLEQLRVWEAREKGEQLARAEHAELSRLRAEVDAADRARQTAERRLVAAERRASDADQEARRCRDELLEVQVDAASAEERQQRLVVLQEELEALGGQYEDARRAFSELQRANRDLQVRHDEVGAQNAALRRELECAREETRRACAEEQREILEKARADLDAWARAQADTRAVVWRAETARLEEALKARDQRIAALEGERDEIRRQRETLRAETIRLAAEAESQKAAAEAHVRVREEALRAAFARSREELTEEAARVREEATREGERRKADLIAEAERFERLVDDLLEGKDVLNAEVQALATEKGELSAAITMLEQQVHDLKIKAVPAEERVAQLRLPVFPSDELPPTTTSQDEEAWLVDLSRNIQKAGFHFHDRLLRAFHTSLKIAHHAPLVVLAGISGTGKSELPRLYADLGGVPFLELAVQPGWDSPADLFGFFNYTDGRLKAEPLARLLHQMGDVEDPLRQSPSLVLLDEMNLARVEYYFADLLSKLEARRALRRADTPSARRRASILLDLGPGAAPEQLFLDERILFVGTMNEDESTLTLSDKVLDRACVLTFPAPRQMEMTEQAQVQRRQTRLSWETWSGWIRGTTKGEPEDRLNEVNEAMAELRRPFGHRLFRAIHAYLANYPGSEEDAWADQIAMKIMPRLRGLETDLPRVRSGLDRLRTFVPGPLSSAFDAARAQEFFAWAGAFEMYRVDG